MCNKRVELLRESLGEEIIEGGILNVPKANGHGRPAS